MSFPVPDDIRPVPPAIEYELSLPEEPARGGLAAICLGASPDFLPKAAVEFHRLWWLAQKTSHIEKYQKEAARWLKRQHGSRTIPLDDENRTFMIARLDEAECEWEDLRRKKAAEDQVTIWNQLLKGNMIPVVPDSVEYVVVNNFTTLIKTMIEKKLIPLPAWFDELNITLDHIEVPCGASCRDMKDMIMTGFVKTAGGMDAEINVINENGKEALWAVYGSHDANGDRDWMNWSERCMSYGSFVRLMAESVHSASSLDEGVEWAELGIYTHQPINE